MGLIFLVLRLLSTSLNLSESISLRFVYVWECPFFLISISLVPNELAKRLLRCLICALPCDLLKACSLSF